MLPAQTQNLRADSHRCFDDASLRHLDTAAPKSIAVLRRDSPACILLQKRTDALHQALRAISAIGIIHTTKYF